MPECLNALKKVILNGIGNFIISQLCQSGFGIPASGSVLYKFLLSWNLFHASILEYSFKVQIVAQGISLINFTLWILW
jgi:hypothetical protein